MNYPLPENEAKRLSAVKRLRILDTPRSEDFDALTNLARSIFDIPVAAVSVLDQRRLWLKSECGLNVSESSRDDIFCNYTVATHDLLIVEDALSDPRFSTMPMVTSAPFVRFYAGVPIEIEEGVAVGTFCLFGFEPRRFSEAEAVSLRRLAAVAGALMKAHRDATERARMSKLVARKNTMVARQGADLREQKRLLQDAAMMAKMGTWENDLSTGRYTWSDEMYALHKVDRRMPVTEESILSFYGPDERQQLRSAIQQSKQHGTPFTFEGPMNTAEGESRWVRVTCHVDVSPSGKLLRRFGMKQDITEERAKSEQLLWIAQHDSLTGLYNRRFLQERYADHIQYNSDGKTVALILFDLDGFKEVNDVHGHVAGDVCLKTVADRVNGLLRQEDLLARIGGDEFALLLKTNGTPTDIANVADRINSAISQPIEWEGSSLKISASVGISHAQSDEGTSLGDLMSRADLALYSAKADGKNGFCFFDKRMRAEVEQRFWIVMQMRQALLRNELELFYQPKVSLADGRHRGYEALLRWRKADGTIETPGTFGVALSDPSLSVEIGRFVICAALDQVETWTRAGVPFGSVAINFGTAQFRDPELADFVLSEIDKRFLDPTTLEIEITEDVVLSRLAEQVLAFCNKLKTRGVRIAFDDFGTGFASLTHLCSFPVDVIKIDRSFVSRLGQDASMTTVVKAIVTLARELKIEIVAEGVETEAQAEFLRAIRCDIAQGYLFGRPVSAADAMPMTRH